MAQHKILVVDDEKSMIQFLSALLRRENYEVMTAGSGAEALEMVRDNAPDVMITDVKMPEMDGIRLLEESKKIDPTLPVIIMTAYASQESAIDALNLGAFQYMEKSAKNDEIKLVVRNALEMRKVRSQNVYLKRQLQKTHATKEIIGRSEQMMSVFKMVDKVAETDSTILIRGSRGPGRNSSPRRSTTAADAPPDRSSPSTAAPSPRTCSSPTCSAT